MAGKVTLIGSYSPSGSSATLNITSIPSTYTDLLVKYSLRTTSGSTAQGEIQFNSNGSGYNYLSFTNSGSGTVDTYSGNVTNALTWQYLYPSSTPTMVGDIYIQDYAAAYKKMIVHYGLNMYFPQQKPIIHYWNNTSAISSIQMSSGGANLDSNGIVSLYGITKS
jgi:hypothetical protein